MAPFHMFNVCGFLFLQSVAGHNPHDVISSVAASPDGKTVFAIVRRLLYRSDDGGINWDIANQGITGIDAKADKVERTIVLSPNFAKDETAFFTNAAGIFRSTDAGRMWKQMTTENVVLPPEGSQVMALSPGFGSTDRRLLVSSVKLGSDDSQYQTVTKIYRSDDGGVSYRAVYDFPSGATHEAPLVATSQYVFAATQSGSLLWSEDFGDNWGVSSLVRPGADTAFHSITEITLSPSSSFWPVLEDGWEAGALLLGSRTQAHVVVYSWNPHASEGELKFNVYPSTVLKGVQGEISRIGAADDDSGYSNVFILPAEGGTIFQSLNGGSNWNARRVVKDRADLGTWELQAAALGANSLSHFVAVKGHIFVGTYCGLHRSIDGGKNWVKLDVETRRFTSLSLARGKSGAINFGACTYGDGCFGGSIDVSKLRKGQANPVAQPTHWNNDRYCTMAFSPNYDADGVVLRRCMMDGQKRYSKVWRSEDWGANFGKFFVPLLPERNTGVETVGGIFSMVFSPNFAEDQTIFVGGVKMGIVVSRCSGKKFEPLFDFGGKATKVYLSPNFKEDLTIAVLAMELYHFEGMEFSDFDAWRGDEIYISNDGGESWKIHQAHQQVESLYFSPNFADDRTLIGLRMIEGTVTRLIKSTDGGAKWSDVDPGAEDVFQGVGRGGFAVAPSGKVLAGKLDGGAIITSLESIVKGNSHDVYKSQVKGDQSAFTFAQDTDSELDVRVTGDMVAFSPNFNTDNMIFGCSFYSLYASFDLGRNWRVVMKLSHTDSSCDVQNCLSCHVKDHTECIDCKSGFQPNGLTGKCEVHRPLSLVGLGTEHFMAPRAPLAAASRWYLELLSILAFVTLAGYALICRLWAFYACREHKHDAESRKGARAINDKLGLTFDC